MNKFYYLLLAGVMCLMLAAPLTADEAIPVDTIQRIPVSLNQGATAACGATIYDNTLGTYFYTSAVPRWNVLDDGAFPAGTAPVCLGCVEFGWYQTTPQQLFVAVDFYDTLVPGGPVCNLTWLGGFVVDLGFQAAGAFGSGPIALPTTFSFPDDDWCVQLRFLSSLSPVTGSTAAGPLFANGGPTVGTNNAGAYYREVSGNGVFECPSEARAFGVPNKSQFYLKLSATENPSATKATKWGLIKAFYR